MFVPRRPNGRMRNGIGYKKRLAKRKKAIAYLGGKCVDCGNTDFDSLTFHHKDPKEKLFQISCRWRAHWETLQPELDKCILLCRHCHEQLHKAIDIFEKGEDYVCKRRTMSEM